MVHQRVCSISPHSPRLGGCRTAVTRVPPVETYARSAGVVPVAAGMIIDTPLPHGLVSTPAAASITPCAGWLPAGSKWQTQASQPLLPEELAQAAASMVSWEEFVRAVAPYGTPIVNNQRALPCFAKRTIRRRSKLSDAAVNSFRKEQTQHILRVAQAHESEPKPRWKLLEKLARPCGIPDTTLSREGEAGYLLHGPLLPTNQWEPRPSYHPKSAAEVKPP